MLREKCRQIVRELTYSLQYSMGSPKLYNLKDSYDFKILYFEIAVTQILRHQVFVCRDRGTVFLSTLLLAIAE